MHGVAEEAAYRLRRLIFERRMVPGDKLPSERELTEMLSVSRSSVRSAIKDLEAQGLVRVSARRGAFITARSSESMAASIRGWFETNRLPLPQLVQFRRAIEPAAASSAAVHRTEIQLARMRELLGEMNEAIIHRNAAAFTDADARFHEAIAASSGNLLFEVLLQALEQPLRMFRESVSRLGRPLLTRSYNDHLAIYEAINGGDEGAAAEAMLRHIVQTNVDFDIIARDEPTGGH
ncbi:FadR/GntR family transcriptional regulator [Nonomuraea sp. H19]|uniref:FadR/GntR family transcriptional regulator n=1 Tax=Nonomuraea sp. H19 TaxID=3452206 RepID=UPI003F889A55